MGAKWEQRLPQRVKRVGLSHKRAWVSVAALAIAPLQDLLNLGHEAQMNVSGPCRGQLALAMYGGDAVHMRMLFTAPDAATSFSGVIIQDETMRQDALRTTGVELLRGSSEFRRFLRDVGGGTRRP